MEVEVQHRLSIAFQSDNAKYFFQFLVTSIINYYCLSLESSGLTKASWRCRSLSQVSRVEEPIPSVGRLGSREFVLRHSERN